MLEELRRLLMQAVRIADAAGREILNVYEAPSIDVRMKGAAGPVTPADLAAEKTIRTGLAELGDIPIISEETKPLPFEERNARSLCWLVDPLDGTKEFIARNGEFTVNIALVRDGRPILGVVGAPALGTMYWAAEGIGAFVRRAGEEPVRISTRGADVPTVVVSRSHGGSALARFLERIGPHTSTSMGSSLKFCLAAQGAAQLYPRLGPTREWDTAAGHCIVVQAGGSVSDFQGKELLYNKRDLLNPWFFAAATKHEHALATAHAFMPSK